MGEKGGGHDLAVLQLPGVSEYLQYFQNYHRTSFEDEMLNKPRNRMLLVGAIGRRLQII